ncbi:MAG: M1 family aminopeptidase [Bacteroidota bacterium]
MKFKFILFLSVFASTTLFSQKEKFSCANIKAKNKSLKSNTLTLDQIAETERYDVNFYHLDLNMTNLSTAISGTVEIHGFAKENLDSVCFELFNSYNISDLKFNGNTVPFGRNLSAIKVPVNLLTGEHFIISVSYDGVAPTASTNPLGGAGLTNDDSPSWGNQVTWSLSEPFSAFEWFPCKQSLKDKADSVYVNITVPSTCKAGSNGVLVNEIDLGNGTTKFMWKHRFPIDYYLVSVAVAEYVDYTVFANPVGAVNPIPIQNYIYNNPGTLPQFQADIDETVNFIEYFSEIFGLYPFHTEKYGHCMAPLGGGMEHQTMTTQGFFEKTLTAHELAHQWWGDHVTCASWADIWVNEGFASYAEYLMLEEMYPAEKVADMADRHTNIKSQLNGSIWVEDSLNGDRIFSSRLTYNKGAAFIHTLRYMINNDSLFMLGLRNFQTNHAFGTALGVDVQQELENVSGLDLSEMFEQWYFGEGFPTYSASWNVVGENLFVNVMQSASMSSITPIFTNDLDLKFQRTGMSDTIIRFKIQSDENHYSIPGMGSVSNLSAVDPLNWIINNGVATHDASLDFTTISEVKSEDLITISPNPSHDFVQINYAKNETFLVKIIDPNGKNCFTKQVKTGEKINISDFQSGLYLFQIESENGKQITRKIVRR